MIPETANERSFASASTTDHAVDDAPGEIGTAPVTIDHAFDDSGMEDSTLVEGKDMTSPAALPVGPAPARGARPGVNANGNRMPSSFTCAW